MSDARPFMRPVGCAALLAAAAAWVLAVLPPQALADRRDPLEPPGHQGGAATGPRFDASAWQLASTLVSSGRRLAIINGRTVRPGDRVGGARVLAVESGRVDLDYQGRRFTVRPATPTVRREKDTDR